MDPTRVDRRIPPARRIVYIAVALVASAVAVELCVRLLYSVTETYRTYRWVVDTHFVDMPYSEFLHREERIREVREALGMERGQFHSVFGHTYNPTFRIDEPNLHLDHSSLQISINSHGLRGEEFPPAKPAGEVRILCLGGSTTAGEEVSDALTYPAQLEAILRQRHPGREIRVINAGVPSYDLRDSFRYYALRLYRFEPDFVTIYHGINDLFDHSLSSLEVSPRNNYNGELLANLLVAERAASERTPVRSLLNKSLVLTLTYRLSRVLWAESNEGDGYLTIPDPRGLEAFVGFYRALIRQIEATGAIPIPMTFAIAYPGLEAGDRETIESSFRVWLSPNHISLRGGKRIIDAQNRSLFALGKQEDIPICDAASVVPAKRRYFVDVCHLTRHGNRRIATALADTLDPLLASAAVESPVVGMDPLD